jgi:hypothetical protein
MYSGSITAGNNDNETGIGGTASASGKVRSPLAMKKPFIGTGSNKLSKSGATTKSESLARLRGKGAIA